MGRFRFKEGLVHGLLSVFLAISVLTEYTLCLLGTVLLAVALEPE